MLCDKIGKRLHADSELFETHMANIVMPPTSSVVRAADLLDEAVGRFLEARRTIPSMGTYEADDEAHLLILLIIRHVEGVTTLARHDLVLLPAATAMARAAFEAAVRVLWMLAPDEPMEREVRWLAGLKEYEAYFRNLANEVEKHGGDASAFRSNERQIQAFRVDVQQALPSEYQLLPKQPKYEDMLKDIGDPKRYFWYRIMSNYTHPTKVATSLYRRHFGISKEFGEFIRPSDWYTCFIPSWFALSEPGLKFLQRCGGDPSAFLEAGFASSVDQAIRAVGDEEEPPKAPG